MKKIRPEELAQASKTFAEMFREYDAYSLFFDADTIDEGRELFFVCETYEGLPFTYAAYDENGDYAAIASVKKPGDKENLLRDMPGYEQFRKRLYEVCGEKALSLACEYLSFSKKTAQKFYDPATDCYIKNVAVAEKARGKGLLKTVICELCGDMPVYLETHNDKNVAVYKKLGFSVKESNSFHGVPFFAMKRESDVSRFR